MNFCPFCGSSNIEKTPDFIKCRDCHETFYLNSKPTASVILVFENQIMVGVRNQEPEKGKLDILGGFLNNGEDPEDGALRELKEESGIEITKSDLNYLGIWVDEYGFRGQQYYTFNVLYYVLFDQKPEGRPNDDVSELKWVDLNSSFELAFKTQKLSIQKLKHILSDNIAN